MRTEYVRDPDFLLLNGGVLDCLASLEDESVHCVVTSPPYWGLRDYGTGQWEGGDEACDHRQDTEHQKQGVTSLRQGRSNVEEQRNDNFRGVCGKCGARRVDNQIGLEATPELYVARMVEIFREVRRVLRSDGTCWLNLGDSYANPSQPSQPGGGDPTIGIRNVGESRYRPSMAPGLKAKDLCGIPWRVAFALQADGWWLRSDIIWSKPNPMPESVTDRPTKAHEYVFLLTKSARYFFDQEAVREPAEWRRWGDQTYSPEAEEMYGKRVKPRTKAELTPRHDGDRWNEANGRGFTPNQAGRNIRSVWEIATQPYPEAHFATYPEELVRRCVLAGTSERGCCPECGAPWEREMERKFYGNLRTEDNKDGHADQERGITRNEFGGQTKWAEYEPPKLLGWRHGCDCHLRCPVAERGAGACTGCPYCETRREAAGTPVPCTVLDPFLGSGTTAHVARKHGRRSIGIELNPAYCQLAAERLQQQSLFAELDTSTEPATP